MKDPCPLPKLLLSLLLFSYTSTAAAQAPGTFRPTGNMTTPRTLHTATLLLNGKVLITGGADPTRPGSYLALASAELFDPNTGTFTATGNMTTRHISSSATLLSDGRVLITGGYGSDDGGAIANLLGVAELYDPSTGTFTATGNMVRPQAGNTSTLLNSGKVLISGICRDWYDIDADAEGDRPELYNPVTGTFSAAGERVKDARWCSGPVTLLANGQVLVAATAELYDPATDTFYPTGRRMTIGFYDSRATLLPNGRVLVAGGSGGVFGASANGELYDPSTGKFTAAGNMIRPRTGHTATLLRDGTVLIAGGRVSASSAELYDPGTATFVSTGDMAVPRAGHTATLLMDGRVLMAGGTNADFASAQLYVPSVLPVQVVVSDLRFDQTNVLAGSSYSLSVSGSNLTSETFIDVRFISPGSNASDVVLNWQKGVAASHDVVAGTASGIWTIIGVRAHEIETDHTGSFFPVSAPIKVSP